MNRKELIDRAVSALNGKLMRSDDEVVIMDNWTKTFLSLKLKTGCNDHTYVCSASEFTQRARELGWCNGYKYGVEYETNGNKPDFPDDVLINGAYQYIEIDESIPVKSGTAEWSMIKKFRIVDKRYKPVEHKENKLSRIFTAKDFPGLPVGPTPEKSWHEKGELPPVGEVCEVIHNGQYGVWRKIEVLKHEIEGTGDSARLACVNLSGEFDQALGELFWLYGVTDDDCKFRPLKTERERFVEAACAVMDTKRISNTQRKTIEKMYKAGFKAPEVVE